MMKLARLALSNSKVRFLLTGMTIICLAQPLLSSVASASPQQPETKSFAIWCSQKESVAAATRYTIDVLLEYVSTKDCKLADRQLKTLTTLNLYSREISDVKPLEGLTNLTELNLGSNQIADVKPLAGLTNLTELSLSNNQIDDMKPLERLTNLTFLNLGSNQIVDVKPLAGLTKLTFLALDWNQIGDAKPLEGLTNLTTLWLNNNPIVVKVCPVELVPICDVF
jgi:internalin A